jgi:hypothetical protein
VISITHPLDLTMIRLKVNRSTTVLIVFVRLKIVLITNELRSGSFDFTLALEGGSAPLIRLCTKSFSHERRSARGRKFASCSIRPCRCRCKR